jgi:hypothetical protein
MDQSIFLNKKDIPSMDDLRIKLGKKYDLWNQIRSFIAVKYPGAIQEWNYPGEKYGWSFRIKDKKRAIVYLLPREGFFKVAFVFGQKATDQILSMRISDEIKETLNAARVYAEGRGIRLAVKDESLLSDIFELIMIKQAN